jgi:hypothetical protein
MKYQQKDVDKINPKQTHKYKLKIITNVLATNTIINLQILIRLKMNYAENFHYLSKALISKAKPQALIFSHSSLNPIPAVQPIIHGEIYTQIPS